MSMQPQELKDKAKGIIHLVMTPFDGNDNVDEKALRESVHWVADKLKGEDAVFLPTGSTGEFYALNDEECKKVAEVVIDEVNGRFPVIVGTGRAGSRYALQMSRYAQDAGADGVMICHPYYHLVTREGIYRHFKMIADGLDIGIMVYNNPVTTKMYVDPELMVRLSKIENIVLDKENTASAPGYYWMQRAVDPEDMKILCGLGQLMYPFEALFDCEGYVTELANFVPAVATDITKAAQQRDFRTLTTLIDKIAPYDQFIAKVAAKRGMLPTVLSPHISLPDLPFYQSICKAAMDLIGLPGGKARDPMENITAQEKNELRSVLKELGVL